MTNHKLEAHPISGKDGPTGLPPNVSNSHLRKSLLIILIAVVLASGVFLGLPAVRLRHHDQNELARTEALLADLQRLTIGKSDYKAARELATKYGAQRFENDWGARDCIDGYFQSCGYYIPINTGALRKIVIQHPLLSHLGLRDWGASAEIGIGHGVVQTYSFVVIFRASNGQLRGIGVEESDTLPDNRAVQAHVSDGYSIERNDVTEGSQPRDLGFELQASITPAASSLARARVWNLTFSCLTQQQGCAEICDLMPDVWQDFYQNRGHFDVEKYGPAYMFCTKPARK